MNNYSHKVKKSFSQAAATYDSHAHLQRQAAQNLAKLLSQQPLPQNVLELGCGTGFLTGAILSQIPAPIRYIATDIAPPMLDKCRQKYGHLSNLQFQIYDANALTWPWREQFQWIVANLLFQWLDNLPATLQHLWAHSQLLSFSLLVEPTLDEWQNLCRQAQLPIGTLPFPSLDELAKDLSQLPDCQPLIETEQISYTYRDILTFLRNLKAIGANTPRSDYKGQAKFKKVFSLHPAKFTATYTVAYVVLKRRQIS